MSAKDPPVSRSAGATITRRFDACDHYSDGTIRSHCGCVDVPFREIVSLRDAKPMPERSAFTDNALYLRHYCDKHWKERQHHHGLPEDARETKS